MAQNKNVPSSLRAALPDASQVAQSSEGLYRDSRISRPVPSGLNCDDSSTRLGVHGTDEAAGSQYLEPMACMRGA